MESNNKLIELINEIANNKGVSKDMVIVALQDAMKKAYEKEDLESCAEVIIDKDTGKISLYKLYTVLDDKDIQTETNSNGVEEKIYNENNQIPLSEAKKRDKNAQVGKTIKEYIDIDKLPRRVVSYILQVFKHGVTIESNKSIYKEWLDKKNTIIYAEVESVNSKSKLVTVNLGKTFGVVTKNDQNPNEKLVPGVKYKFYIKDILEQTKGWPIILSRTHGAIVQDLLNINIPEIQNKIVQVIKVGRLAGFKSKVVVKSTQEGVDPIGACIGARADRIKPILTEMGEEKIEFVAYDDNLSKYLVNICNPAILSGYKIVDAVYETNDRGIKKEIQRKKIIFIVSEAQLALIIGQKGKNVKVLSDLLDADIEIITIEEANIAKIEYVKVDKIAPTFVKKQSQNQYTNKFSSIYDKYHVSTNDLLDSIDKNNESTKVKQNEKLENNDEEQTEKEEIQIQNVDLKSYANDLAEIDELTKDVNKKK